MLGYKRVLLEPRHARKDMAFGKQAHYSFHTHHMQRAIQH